MRHYGRFTTSITRDEDFRQLTAEEQGVYYTIGLQPEISAAGTLPLTYRRWAKQFAGQTPDSLRALMLSLQDRGHFAIDEDTEELLIVKFVKWDGGYRNSKRLPVILEAASGTASPILRRALATELTRLGLSDAASDALPDALSDSPSDAVTPSDRVVVTKGEYVPQPPNRNPQPSGRPPADAAPGIGSAAVAAFVANSPEVPADTLQSRVERQARQLAKEGHDPQRILTAAANAATAGWHDLAVQMQRDAARASPTTNGSTTDNRVRAALDLAERLDQPRPERKSIR